MMAVLEKKIDFIGFIVVDHANPNGDPLNGNQPRTNYDGYGEMTEVCIKRKMRNRLQDAGERILVQADERSDDGCDSIRSRVEKHPKVGSILAQMNKGKGKDQGVENKREMRLKFEREACSAWIDVRAFGQVFALKKQDKKKARKRNLNQQILMAYPSVCAAPSRFMMPSASILSPSRVFRSRRVSTMSRAIRKARTRWG